ncbi:helix-turn-helix domain-containing protein [Lactobacillus sp. CBA3605]|uniref:helix-turn-helix domain-containing protein n=1 Tax=Lactobacillus sp. CBA3605 TaxID=2099788 RepID=UPI001F2E2B46|nr:helix-turn-helix domain-containing protein [Lactobacillus sp. CBA3605]
MVDKTFGSRLKELRMQKGYSVRRVALYGGISSSYYSQVENNKRKIPKPETLRKIATGLRISTNTIFELAGLLPENSNPELNLSPTQTAHKISLIGANDQIILPTNQRVYTQLPPLGASHQTHYYWLRITEDNMHSEGILPGDLAIISTNPKLSLFSEIHRSRLVAVNLKHQYNTVIRRVLWITDDHYFIINPRESEEPLVITGSEFKTIFTGVVINVHRAING